MGYALIWGAIIAAVSGITFVAYRGPSAYEKVNRAIAVILLVALVGGGFWNFGVRAALQVLSPYVSPNQEANAIGAAETLQLSTWYLLAVLGISIYCLLLPVILRGKKSSDQTNNGE
jgi:hypothetical protein